MKSMHLLALSILLVAVPDARAFDPWSDPARYELVYDVDLGSLPESPWRLWVPLPNFSYDQHEIDLRIEAPVAHAITWDDRGNRMVHLESTGPAQGRLLATVDLIREPSGGLPSHEIVRNSPDDPSRHLAARRLVPLDGVIADLGRLTTKDAETPEQKVRAIYDYVLRTMRYAKHGEGWGRGDAVWACTSKYGNCTDFHSVLLGMARSQAIPARFVMGVPIPPDAKSGSAGGYHCWAQVHLEERGWIQLDASEASKRKTPDAYFGQVPSDRVAFTIGRDLVLSPPQSGEPLNYFFAPYLEVAGEPVEPPAWELRFRRIPLQIAERPDPPQGP